MALLIVGLTPALATALARGDRTSDTTRLHSLTQRARIDLRPQSERSLDDEDEREPTIWFWAETGTGDQPDDLGEQLLLIPGVTSAFVKPADGLP